ncbi:MAG: hypothetical protein EA393_02955 [Bacteroidetes bacterium]|nr:MAG: hypothetical protein EA393_02955 [Bacteroidota bacterium]
MAGEVLNLRFSALRQVRLEQKGKCFENPTSHILKVRVQNGRGSFKTIQLIENKYSIRCIFVISEEGTIHYVEIKSFINSYNESVKIGIGKQ